MSASHDPQSRLPEDYSGRILTGPYADDLKERVAEYIACYRAFDRTGNPAIPYIAGGEGTTREIWYEFVGSRLVKLLRCAPHEVAGIFREGVSNRRMYECVDSGAHIRREVIGREEIHGARGRLREAAKRKGIIEAVYKLSLPGKKVLWLKDIARLEQHGRDRIFLSLGNLTILSKEMKAEEERLGEERLRASLETAGAVCHELNQCIQSISAYSEVLMGDLAGETPSLRKIRKIMDQTCRMGQITRRLMRFTRYRTKDYVEGVRIVDIEKSAR